MILAYTRKVNMLSSITQAIRKNPHDRGAERNYRIFLRDFPEMRTKTTKPSHPPPKPKPNVHPIIKPPTDPESEHDSRSTSAPSAPNTDFDPTPPAISGPDSAKLKRPTDDDDE